MLVNIMIYILNNGLPTDFAFTNNNKNKLNTYIDLKD